MNENQIAEMQYWDEKKKHILTLRDQFAMAALTGYVASMGDTTWPSDPDDEAGAKAWVQSNIRSHAKNVYAIADAMMKARDE